MAGQSTGYQIGKYRIMGEIGRGGMAVVYKGYDADLQRSVAIKVLPEAYATDPQFVQRFRHEAIMAARLNHPNIVAIHDVGQQGNSHYIVMQYLPGANLDQIIAHNGPISLEAAVAITCQVAAALDHAHQHGIVHRDIKPSNVMISPEGQVTLMDFGLVRAGESSGITRVGTIVGTPEFMSPEQAQGAAIDHRTDLYSLGLVLYKALSGVSPFVRSTPYATLLAQISQEPPLDGPLAQLPNDVKRIVQRALAKEPEKRYQSAGAFAADLQRATGVSPDRKVVVAMPSATAQPAKSPRQPAQPEVEPTVLLGADRQPAPLARPTDPARPTSTPGAKKPTPVPGSGTRATPQPMGNPATVAPARAHVATPLPVAHKPRRGLVWGIAAVVLVAVTGLALMAVSFAGRTRPTPEPTPVPATAVVPSPTVLPPTAEPAPTATLAAPSLSMTIAPSTSTPTPAPPSPTPVVIIERQVVVVTATPEPTSTRAPTATPAPPTATPPAPPTEPPSPTAPGQSYEAPGLLSPRDGETTTGQAAFAWTWNGPALDANQGFEVRLWKEGQAEHYGAAEPVNGASLTIDVRGTYGVSQGGGGAYWWTVAVVQRNPYLRVGAEAQPRKLTIQIEGGARPSPTPIP